MDEPLQRDEGKPQPAPGFAAFISHATEDHEAAQAIAEAIERRGLKCWIAPRDVTPGRAYGSEIVKGIESARCFVLVLSAS
ncbi:MAG: toll/interleukin-1 receptor domain-containing protein, partial [Pseudomonadota bacterium]